MKIPRQEEYGPETVAQQRLLTLRPGHHQSLMTTNSVLKPREMFVSH